jgi:adenylyl-sulfate kinase
MRKPDDHPSPPPSIIWLTGLPGSGKTTIARGVATRLRSLGIPAVVLDGDELRAGLCADLTFSIEDRFENVRRAGEVARLLVAQGIVAICALVSPYAEARARVRARSEPGTFIETYVKADVATCRARDPKGLYAQAERGAVAALTGLSAPYEPPLSPELTIDTTRLTPDASIEMVLERLGAVSRS